MQTKPIPGVPPRQDDQEILKAINATASPDGGGNTMCIGIRNEAGQIYRAVSTEGLGEFMAVVGALLDRGMVDELAEEYQMREGCDAIFS